MKPEDKIYTEQNIKQKRIKSKAMMEGLMMAEKLTLDEAASKTERTCFQVKTSSNGAPLIDVYMIKPKSL